MKNLDFVIIGGGPAGYTAAVRAAQQGRSVTLFEKADLGGVCLNRGCIPTKAAVEVARVVRESLHAGAVLPQQKDLWNTVKKRVRDAVETDLKGIERLLKNYEVEIRREKVQFVNEKAVGAPSGEYSFQHCLIATGTSPWTPEKIHSEEAWTEETWLQMESLPESCIVIGGGVAGCEIAFVLQALGVQVTLVEMAPQILPFVPADIAGTLERELKKQKVRVIKNFRVERVEGKNGEMHISGSGETLTAKGAILALGRQPCTAELNLEKAGVETSEDGFIVINSSMQTSNPHIYAAGDITGPPFLAHRAYHQAIIAAENACGTATTNTGIFPYAVFTEPEAAGFITPEVQLSGLANVKVPVRVLGRAHASGKLGGEVKILYEETSHRIRGIYLISHGASEIISALYPAFVKGLFLEDLAYAPLSHPTFSEVLREAALKALGVPHHAL